MNEKDIKKEIRTLKKLKRQMRAGSSDRIEIHRRIKELQVKVAELKGFDEAKKELVEKIKRLDHSFEKLGINLYKFSKEELEKHLSKLK